MTAERNLTRVALLADTFHELNGAAGACREWEAYARRHECPFLCLRWRPAPGARQEGSVRVLEMKRSSLKFRIVREGATGYIAPDDATFCERAATLAGDPETRCRMVIAARRQVEGQTWDRTFTEVYDGYSKLLQPVR